MLRNCIFYLLLQIKTRYEVEKKKKSWAETEHKNSAV